MEAISSREISVISEMAVLSTVDGVENLKPKSQNCVGTECDIIAVCCP
jgi:hypothetical protein